MDIKIKKSDKNENLEDLSKEELIARIKAIEAHNVQLKNIIAKTGPTTVVKPKNKPYDFSKCHFRHILLKFFYLGWDYKGYAVQEDTTNTIENYLFNALHRTCLIKDRQSSNYHRCGRTDKGVSSFGQAISIDIRSKLTKETEDNISEELDYCQMLNSVLPDDIQCIAWCPVDSDYSARFNCNYRTYKYFFPKGNLDIKKMESATKLLLGSHDFRNFCKMDVGNGVVQFIRHIKEISIDPLNFQDNELEYSMYAITIQGKAFLWHQIRCIMSILFLIGQNKEEPNVIQELLDVEKNPRKPEYSMASEIPLNLFYCDYNDITWIYDKTCLEKVADKLRRLWCFNSVKESMIKCMIDNLQDALNSINTGSEESETGSNCMSEILIQGVKHKMHIPLLSRQKCESLEEKIKYFSKRRRIQILNKKDS